MKNSTCPYFRINCEDATRIYDESLCIGEGNFENCGTYQSLTKIQEQVAGKTRERGRNIVAILT